MRWMNNFQFHRTIKKVLLPLWHALLNETNMRQALDPSLPSLLVDDKTLVSRGVYQELYKCLVQLLVGEHTSEEAQRMAEVCSCKQIECSNNECHKLILTFG